MGADDFLPGMEGIEQLLAEVPMLSNEDIDERAEKRFPKITLERVKAERPDLVEQVARGFFNLGLSIRDLSYLTGLHRNVCKAIINERDGAKEVKKVQRHKLVQVHQLGNIAIERLKSLLMDPAAVKKAGINGIMDVARRLHDMEEALTDKVDAKTVDAVDVRVIDFSNSQSDAEKYLN